MKQNNTPFLYRSFFNFWLVLILPAGIITALVTHLIAQGSLSSNFFKLPSTYAKFVLFQVIFGTWMYYRDYKPKSKKFRENA
ncbi:hypothetical protein J2X69_000860 [Algoriphagus sp. 4150]|uniref:hypothetical protein n=1 Tax=Algoriphagus sp. 4150 TaxID=2817756 RepID=UPI00286017B0|nr:hypothetical protein [Algoriphagus sp. 4150]MDR7128528.1 hypothetical protein [Algoriphagus sp. 4150]